MSEPQIRDHFLVNCPEMQQKVTFPLHHKFDLRALLHVPCGRQAESKFYYLAEILAFYKSKQHSDAYEPPQISLQMHGLLEIDGEPFIKTSLMDNLDPALFKSTEFADMLNTGGEDERMTANLARRRCLRALETISRRVHDNMLTGSFEQRDVWVKTLTMAANATKFLLDEAKTSTKYSKGELLALVAVSLALLVSRSDEKARIVYDGVRIFLLYWSKDVSVEENCFTAIVSRRYVDWLVWGKF